MQQQRAMGADVDTQASAIDPIPAADSRGSMTPGVRILAGLHAGARRDGLGTGMLVIGAADDCDLILADNGVAPHHAILGITSTGWSVRALDGAVVVASRAIPPGDSVVLDWFDVAHLGPVSLSVGDPDSPRWTTLSGPAAATEGSAASARSSRRKRLLVAAIGLPICAATAITAASLRPHEEPQPPSQRSLLERTVQEVSLETSRIEQDTRGKLRVSGLATDDTKVERLRDNLAARGVVAEVAVRSGKDIARDVAEVLRLSNLDAETGYRGKGEVGIRGHFGDGTALDEVLASRALRDVKGLAKVAVVNLDAGAPAPPPVAADAEARHIVVAVGGRDPYVITGDGSRYFAGAELPCGGRLHAVDGATVFVDAAAGAGTLDCTGAIEMARLPDAARAGPPEPASTPAVTAQARQNRTAKSAAKG